MNLFAKQQERNKCRETNVWIPSGGRRNQKIGIDTYTLLILCIKQITNKNILCSTGNSTGCGDPNGKEIQKGGAICICMADSLCCTVDSNIILQTNYTPIKINLKNKNENSKNRIKKKKSRK